MWLTCSARGTDECLPTEYICMYNIERRDIHMLEVASWVYMWLILAQT